MLQAKRRSMFYTCPVCGAWPHVVREGCSGCADARGSVAVRLSAGADETRSETWCDPGLESPDLQGSSPCPAPIETQ
jgi:hypothetical protein